MCYYLHIQEDITKLESEMSKKVHRVNLWQFYGEVFVCVCVCVCVCVAE